VEEGREKERVSDANTSQPVNRRRECEGRTHSTQHSTATSGTQEGSRGLSEDENQTLTLLQGILSLASLTRLAMLLTPAQGAQPLSGPSISAASPPIEGNAVNLAELGGATVEDKPGGLRGLVQTALDSK
jgi:hypothetical protein